MDAFRILLVDPNEHTRAEMQQWLEEEGQQVITACTGNEAIEWLKTGHFDVVVTEVLLPDGDGLDIIKFSRKSGLPHRIIAMSGGGSYLTRLDCLKLAKLLGAHAVSLKPMTRQQLLSAVGGKQPVPVAAIS
jgi:CheY-like chemotaxis protein